MIIVARLKEKVKKNGGSSSKNTKSAAFSVQTRLICEKIIKKREKSRKKYWIFFYIYGIVILVQSAQVYFLRPNAENLPFAKAEDDGSGCQNHHKEEKPS